MDSLDPEQKYGDWSYKDLENPTSRQDPKYPRLMIENRCYQSEVFRKLHMEVASRQDGLEVMLNLLIQKFPSLDIRQYDKVHDVVSQPDFSAA